MVGRTWLPPEQLARIVLTLHTLEVLAGAAPPQSPAAAALRGARASAGTAAAWRADEVAAATRRCSANWAPPAAVPAFGGSARYALTARLSRAQLKDLNDDGEKRYLKLFVSEDDGGGGGSGGERSGRSSAMASRKTLVLIDGREEDGRLLLYRAVAVLSAAGVPIVCDGMQAGSDAPCRCIVSIMNLKVIKGVFMVRAGSETSIEACEGVEPRPAERPPTVGGTEAPRRGGGA
eukprot:276203-Chlamydomonas_euryale.AAC.2